jgi:uncharacterized protein (UPF0335 family)
MTNSRLQSIVDRIERLEEERKALTGDIRDINAEAQGKGYHVKALRKILRERKEDTAERAEIEAAMDAGWLTAPSASARSRTGRRKRPSPYPYERLRRPARRSGLGRANKKNKGPRDRLRPVAQPSIGSSVW